MAENPGHAKLGGQGTQYGAFGLALTVFGRYFKVDINATKYKVKNCEAVTCPDLKTLAVFLFNFGQVEGQWQRLFAIKH